MRCALLVSCIIYVCIMFTSVHTIPCTPYICILMSIYVANVHVYIVDNYIVTNIVC